MIAYIDGILSDISEYTVVVECNGLGYELFVPQSVYQILPPVGSSIKLYTFLNVKEDGVTFFGFASKDDLNVFKLLITVNGIGPKGAVAILSFFSADELRFAVLAEDAKTIAKAPGIGAKTAGKLIIELKDKFKLEDAFEQKLSNMTAQAATQEPQSAAKDEAVQALVALGYSPTDAMRAVKQIKLESGMTAEDILKLSLKNIGR